MFELSVEETNVIDAIGLDNATGDVVPTIIDHLEWSEDDKEHLLLLQEKINSKMRGSGLIVKCGGQV